MVLFVCEGKCPGTQDKKLEGIEMEKYIINFKCGHSIETKVKGITKDDREMYAAKLEKDICRHCKSAQAAKSTSELPRLIGSEAQITWATTIRASKIKAARKLIDSYKGRLESAVLESMADDLKSLEDKIDAGWWIKHRQANA